MYGYEGTKKSTIATIITYLEKYNYCCHYSTIKIESKKNGNKYELYHNNVLVYTSNSVKDVATKMYNSQWGYTL